MSEFNARQIQRKLKLSGLEVRKDALEAIESVLSREDDPRSALEKLLACLKERIAVSGKASCIVDRALVQDAVVDLSKNDQDMVAESIVVWDAFRIPRSNYNPTSKQFKIEKNVTESLHDDPSIKAQFLAERYNFVHQKLIRHPLFAQRTGGGLVSDQTNIVLTPIEALAAGGNDNFTVHHVLGVLTKVDEDALWLEDPTGKVPLEIREGEVTYGEGYFTVGCVVIAAGTLQSVSDIEEENAVLAANIGIQQVSGNRSLVQKHYVLRVSALMMPSVESRKDTEKVFPGLSRRLLGLNELSAKDSQSMELMELESDTTSFIMLSEVYLDDADTMRSLRRLFEGLEENPPELFVFMGNFSRRPFGLANRTIGSEQISAEEFTGLFEQLASLMLKFPSLLGPDTRWVFIPGPRDPSASPKDMLPRSCLPKTIFRRFTERLPETCRVTFSSNPCRIMFYKQELCFFRNDTMLNMRRNCIVPSTTGMGAKEASKILISTICSQGHLCPLTLDTKPIYCSYERGLRLFPLPDVLVLADQYEQYDWKNNGCTVLNPGSFSADGSFVFYRPATIEVGFSMVPRESKQDQE